MYKRTIWQDDVEGVQEGTDQSAANFNNLEAGTMEANAIAALNTAYQRHNNDIAKNTEVVYVQETFRDQANTEISIAIPLTATRNRTNYNVSVETLFASDGNSNIGNIIILSKQANGFKFKYTGTATQVAIKFNISGGMI